MPVTETETKSTTPSKPGSNILRYKEWQPLDAIFAPRSVAVVGATEKQGSVGRTILWNLISSPFGGTVFPVNPKRSNVLGIRAYPAVADIPEPPELAVIVTPAPTVPGLIRECGEAGVGQRDGHRVADRSDLLVAEGQQGRLEIGGRQRDEACSGRLNNNARRLAIGVYR